MMSTTMNKQEILRGGEFMVKKTAPGDMFIPEDFNEEQRMIHQMCIDFVKEIGGRKDLLEEQPKLLEEAGELGLLGSHMPEEYGGMQLDSNTNTLIVEALGAAGGSFDTSFAAHTGIGMLPILYFGTEEQKKKYLPGLTSGELKAAYCLTEPGSGSDALAAKTRADLSEDGKHYMLTGQKMWISNAGFADVFIVFAKINGVDFTGFIVEADSPGIKLGAEEHKMGIKGSSTRQVFFENTPVPVENLLGEQGKGHYIAFNALNIGRFKLGAMAMGGSKYAIDISVKYANERYQFNQPIAQFGAIKYKIAEQIMKTFAVESATYRVSDLMQKTKDNLLEEGELYGDAMVKSAKEYASECAIIKVAGSEYLDYVLDEMVQIHGGYGYSEEYPAARPFRDARINRIYEGTNEVNRQLMVSQILKSAFTGKIDLVGPAWEVQKELLQMPSREIPEGAFGQEEKAILNLKKILLLVAGAAAKYQMDGKHDLRQEQMIVSGIANIAMDLFIAESLLLRRLKLEDPAYAYEHGELVTTILKLFIYDAQDRVVKEATDCLGSFATGDELSIMLKGVRRFSKYPNLNVKEARTAIADAAIEANGYPLG
jgi:alkylation response protein AidB-like acyl-CoA dehydrogenase